MLRGYDMDIDFAGLDLFLEKPATETAVKRPPRWALVVITVSVSPTAGL